jgi:hypothetical protein
MDANLAPATVSSGPSGGKESMDLQGAPQDSEAKSSSNTKDSASISPFSAGDHDSPAVECAGNVPTTVALSVSSAIEQQGFNGSMAVPVTDLIPDLDDDNDGPPSSKSWIRDDSFSEPITMVEGESAINIDATGDLRANGVPSSEDLTKLCVPTSKLSARISAGGRQIPSALAVPIQHGTVSIRSPPVPLVITRPSVEELEVISPFLKFEHEAICDTSGAFPAMDGPAYSTCGVADIDQLWKGATDVGSDAALTKHVPHSITAAKQSYPAHRCSACGNNCSAAELLEDLERIIEIYHRRGRHAHESKGAKAFHDEARYVRETKGLRKAKSWLSFLKKKKSFERKD